MPALVLLWKMKVMEGFQSISSAPHELFKAYLLKFLDSFSYFSFSLIFTLFLTADFGYSDVLAGTIYGAWGAAVTLFGLLTGVIVDSLGVSTSLRIGFAVQLLGKCILFYTTSRTILLLAMCVLSFGGCLGIPVLSIGIRRYTTKKNRGFAFGLFYVIMNVAALISGPVVDYCTIMVKGESEAMDKNRISEAYANSETIEWSLTGYRVIVLLGILTNILACIITFTIKEIKVNDPEVDDAGEDKASNTVKEFQPDKSNKYEIIKETLQSSNFWKFLCVIMITLNVRMIFRHLDATLPKYMMREFGENVAKGTIYSINPLLIIILVPIVTAATSDVDPLVMIHHGCYISAASVFALAISTSIPSCIIFVTVLSIGEAVWSPRLYDYTCSVAKEGREGTYMALSSAPLFLVKLPVGMMSGYLLQKYCPEEGPRESRLMWLIIGLTTAVSPILLTLCWGYVSKKDEDGNGDIEEIESSSPSSQVLGQEMIPLAVENNANPNYLKRRRSN